MMMKHAMKLLGGAFLGRAAVYLLEQQSGGQRRTALLHGEWPLPARVAAGAIGSALAWHGTSRRIIPGIPLALTGFGLLGRALLNGGPASWSWSWMDRDIEEESIRGKTVKKTMTIGAPIDYVFNFWRRYD